jgi:HicA toxin of bacterial toxin-antitoxin,
LSKTSKLLRVILDGRSDGNIRFPDLCYVLAKAGFTLRPGKGSHHIFFKNSIAEIINLQPAAGKAKAYQVKQVRDLLVKYKLEVN